MIVRKQLWLIAGLLVVAGLILAACGGGTTGPAEEVDELTVAIWGGIWGDSYKQAAIDAFTEESGIEVEMVTNVEDSLALLATEVDKDEPVYDILWLSDAEFHIAINSDLLASVNYDNVPNAENLYEIGKHEHGVSSEIGAWGIAYNQDLVSEAPTSWADLLEPDAAPLVGFITPSSAGPQVHNLGILAMAAGGSYEDAGTLGIEQAKTLAENGAQFGSFAEISTLFANGEVGYATFFHQEPIYYSQDGLPAGFVMPEEGAFPVGAWMTMPANLSEGRKQAAEQFMSFVVSQEAQTQIAEAIFSGPINSSVELPADLEGVIHPFGQAEIDSLVAPDWDFILENQEDWFEAWKREVQP